MISSEDFIRLTIEHIEMMEIRYSFLLNIRVVEGKSTKDYYFRKDDSGFFEIPSEDYERLIEESTGIDYKYEYKNRDKYELEVFVKTKKRFEGVAYDVEVVDGKPKIIERSMDLICMLKKPEI